MYPDVVVVGSYVQDLTWQCAAFPRPGETIVGTFVPGPGGKGSNQAIAAARAGARTGFIGAVGKDGYAAEARRFYRQNRVACHLVEKSAQPTGTAGILVSATGQNAIVVALGANAHLQSRDLKRAWLENAKIVIAQCESNLTATLAALKVARKAGALTVLNPAPMRADFDPGILRWVDVLIPNETEFVSLQQRLGASVGKNAKLGKDLARLSLVEMQRRCRSFGVETVIVTLGSQGCVLSRPDKATAVRGFEVDAVDTTGAGDAFVGGFAAGLLQRPGDFLDATHYATAVAALSVTRVGTAPAMPWKRDVTQFLRRQQRV